VPYGYLAQRIPHPTPAKAAQGATKTRLVPDPDRAPVVARIFALRALDKLGRVAIARRLNADPTVPRPAIAKTWTAVSVAGILANPKYTGHMVFGWERKISGKMTAVPASEWLWSPEPTHLAIIGREVFDMAQEISAVHSSSRDGTGPSAHPATRRTYALRGRIRHRTCHRRMQGITRPSSRYYTDSPDVQLTCYQCPYDPARAAAPEAEAHPRTVSIREDALTEVLRGFFATRIFGPERRALLAELFPDGEADRAARDPAAAGALRQRLRQVEAAENAYAREIEALAGETTAAPAAVTALRSRILARFTELEAERAAIGAQLTKLETARDSAPDVDLLDLLPILGDLMAHLPGRLYAQLYDAFGIEILYRHDSRQVTIHATITAAAPGTLAQIIGQCDNLSPALTAAFSDSEWNPGTPGIRRDHERAPPWRSVSGRRAGPGRASGGGRSGPC